MVQKYKDLSKAWKTIVSVCVALATIAGGIKGYVTIKEHVVMSVENVAKPYVEKHAKIVVKDELLKQKTNKSTSYRYQKAHALGIPIDSVLDIDLEMYMAYQHVPRIVGVMDSIEIARTAAEVYIKTISLYLWREMEEEDHNGVLLRYSPQTGLRFYMEDGYIFEAYYKGSTDAYWFKDAFGNERICY